MAVFGKTLDQGFVTVENNKTGEKFDMTLEQLVANFTELEKYRKNNYTLENIIKKNSDYIDYNTEQIEATQKHCK